MTRFERWMLWVPGVIVTVTGIGFGWIKYFVEPSDPYAVVRHPLEPWLLKIHIVAAPFLVFGFGLVFMQHILRQWRSGRPSGRRSGLATALTVIPMILSGYLIQTVTGRTLVIALVVVHIVTGLAYFGMFSAHQVFMSRRERRRRDDALRRATLAPAETAETGHAAARARVAGD